MELDRDLFLPVSREDMARRGWDFYDFLLITGDAYVDHPSFGPAIIGRVLEAEGYRVAVLSQPDWRRPEAFSALGRPPWSRTWDGAPVHREARPPHPAPPWSGDRRGD